jgi:hypothetical protein
VPTGDELHELEALSSSCIEDVLRAMDDFVDSAAMQETCLAIIRDFGGNPRVRASLLKAGSAAKVFRAMDRHLSLAAVQEVACAAIVNLAGDVDAQPDIALWVGPDESGSGVGTDVGASEVRSGLDRIYRAMMVHGISSVLECGCWALWSLSFHPASKSALLKSGGVTRILQAQQKLPNDPAVDASASKALAALL